MFQSLRKRCAFSHVSYLHIDNLLHRTCGITLPRLMLMSSGMRLRQCSTRYQRSALNCAAFPT